MLTKIAVTFIMVLGTLCAQTKTDNKQWYACDSGMWMERDFDYRPTEAQVKAAEADCRAKYKAERVREEEMDLYFENRKKELEEKISEASKKVNDGIRRICEERDHFRQDGTDEPLCKGIPPRLEALKVAHKLCAQLPEPKFWWCSQLIPFSMGKATPPTK